MKDSSETMVYPAKHVTIECLVAIIALKVNPFGQLLRKLYG